MPSVILAGTTTGTALSLTSDTSGELQIRTNNGATTAMTLTTGGNINIPTLGARITGDFSNATLANRVYFQTSTTNSNTTVPALPNGTANQSQFLAYNGTDPANSGFAQMLCNTAEMSLRMGIAGTGTLLPLTMWAGGSERLRIDTSGNVGIGTSSPTARLDARGAIYAGDGTNSIQIGAGWGGTATQCYVATGGASTQMIFGLNGTERMRITNGGDVGIGTSSPQVRLQSVASGTGLQEVFRVGNTQSRGAGVGVKIGFQPNNDFVSNGLIGAAVSAVNTSGSAANDISLAFSTGSGGAESERMRITSGGQVGIGTNNPGGILTATASGGAGISIGQSNENFYAANLHRFYDLNYANERMRIDSSGNLAVGTSSAAAKFDVFQSSNTTNSGRTAYIRSSWSGDASTPAMTIAKFDNNNTTSQIFVKFEINNTSTASGQINANGANTAAFGSTSDERVKENIVDLPSQLDNIMGLRPVEFDYIESYGGGHQIGFIAQEMQEVYPDVVSTDDSEKKILSITGWSKTEARLVKAIQEQQTLIENLTTRLNALEGK